MRLAHSVAWLGSAVLSGYGYVQVQLWAMRRKVIADVVSDIIDPPEPPLVSCATCVYSEPWADEDGQGHMRCVWGPPMILLFEDVDSDNGVEEVGVMWPPVNESLYCGQWRQTPHD